MIASAPAKSCAIKPASPEVQLPAELWEKVLLNLNTYQLAQARATCRQWNEIVRRSPVLMNRFVVHFPQRSTLEPEAESVRVFAGSKARYSRVVLDSVTITEQVDRWWPVLGQELRTLTVEGCRVSTETVLKILSLSPKLKRFTFRCGSEHDFRSGSVADFKLGKLEVLRLDRIELLEVLRGFCPGLRLLKLEDGFKPISESYERTVLEFVETVQDTLEGIKLEQVSAFLLEKISSLSRLHLQRISLEGSGQYGEQDLIEFSRLQGSIQHFNVTSLEAISDAGLRAIGTNLPNLKRLKISLREVSTPLPPVLFAVECLAIRSSRTFNHLQIDFGGHINYNLRKITLAGMRIPRNSLLRHMIDSRNIRTIHFERNFFESGSCLFEAIRSLKYLESLTLEGINVDRTMDCLSERSTDSNVRRLHLSRCVFRKEVLVALSRLFPWLQEVRLTGVRHVEASEILLLWCQGLPRLKRLTFEDCVGFTDASAGHIRRFCPVLERLNLWNCHGLSASSRERMMAIAGVQVDIRPELCLEV
ncbi:hypothetical protein quinque_015356 [Culex quinquefasciatus]